MIVDMNSKDYDVPGPAHAVMVLMSTGMFGAGAIRRNGR
jgi:hypothetical protein